MYAICDELASSSHSSSRGYFVTESYGQDRPAPRLRNLARIPDQLLPFNGEMDCERCDPIQDGRFPTPTRMSQPPLVPQRMGATKAGNCGGIQAR